MSNQASQAACPSPMGNAKPQAEHLWLKKLLGEWAFESEAPAGDGQPPQKAFGTEQVHALGDLWVIAHAQGTMPGGGEAQWRMTLGFSPEKNRFVGTWVGSMMTHQWVYEGELDASGKELPLYCDGPPSKDGKATRFKDVLAWIDDDHRTVTGWMTDEKGQWQVIMTGHYTRVK